MRGRRAQLAMALVLGATLLAPATLASAADPVPPYIAPSADWLTVVNYYRSMSGLSPVVEDAALSPGAYNHSCYMLYNGISHDEIPGLTGYTANGDIAGNSGNVAVSSGYGATVRSHIELWMTGPFHAIGILRHNLQKVGFGKCDLTATPTWHSGATLNVLSGLNYSVPRPATPIVFPGNGTTTNLYKFITESPNPMTFCNWTGAAGLPVIAMMPEKVTSVMTSITGPNGAIETCPLYAGNTSGAASAILAADNAVTVMPRTELTPGVYTVTVTTNARTVKWSFTVDPTAASGVMPLPMVAPSSTPSAFTSVTPFRFADSRSSLRITKLLAGVPKRIQVSGQGGIPTDATALSANFTATDETGVGYLTVYNCTATAPTAATLNYYPMEPVGNAGLFPLGTAGELCLVSPKDINVVIDVNGYFRPASNLKYEGLIPTPVVDTTSQLNTVGRIAASQTLTVDVTGSGVGVPAGASAVAVNITGIWPSANGYVTAFPCGVSRPVVASVNPTVGTTKQNFAIVPLSAAGQLCLFSLQATDLKVDVLGYFMPSSPHTMIPSTPTRVTDTRDQLRPLMNLGTGGSMLTANTTKTLSLGGQRGIPANATVVSVNVAAVAPGATGSVTLWGCGSEPQVQSVNFAGGRTVATGIQVQLSSAGELCVRSTADTHLVIDVTGWWV